MAVLDAQNAHRAEDSGPREEWIGGWLNLWIAGSEGDREVVLTLLRKLLGGWVASYRRAPTTRGRSVRVPLLPY